MAEDCDDGDDAFFQFASAFLELSLLGFFPDIISTLHPAFTILSKEKCLIVYYTPTMKMMQ